MSLSSSCRSFLKFGCRSISSTSRLSSLFYEDPNKEGYAVKSDWEKEWEKKSYLEKLKLEWEIWKTEGQYFLDYWKERLTMDRYLEYRPGEVDAFYRFNGLQENLDKWIVTADSDIACGYSTARLDLTEDGKGLFHGNIDTNLPKDGRFSATGFASMKAKPYMVPFRIKSSFDWTMYTHLVFKVRGDGRIYMANLYVNRNFDVNWYDMYHYFLYTRGGPYWQIIKIPFSRFVFGYKGRIQSGQDKLHLLEVTAVGITIADRIPGPYRLEIDWIGVEFDPAHTEKSAYELYQQEDAKIWY